MVASKQPQSSPLIFLPSFIKEKNLKSSYPLLSLSSPGDVMDLRCSSNAFPYNSTVNSTLCACDPGYFLANGSCARFDVPPAGDWAVSSGVGQQPTLLTAVLSLDSIRRLTQSQAVLLEATFVGLLVWLVFSVAVRFAPVRGGRSLVFRIRWWISRVDSFATQHYLDDQKVVTKRKTELGGTLSVASWILLLGLQSALLYQIITKRSIEVHRVRPANAPDLQSFVNDMEFNITTISSLSCSHLRGLDTLVTGTPGFIDYRTFPLPSYVNSYCHNTSMGPTISLKCSSCQIPRRDHFITWQFVDLPNTPAMAVAFQFNFTAKGHGDDKHVSFVSGTVTSDNYTNDKLRTFRGRDGNILKIHLFPQAFNYLHNLKLIQPLFHDFIPGSSFSEASDLRSSLQRSKDGLLNITLYIRYLADYIVEVDHENVTGPVGFLADVGGLYALSVAIFLYFLVQCEVRSKKLRNEDTVMRNIRSKRRALRNWNKLRKFVMYTWGPSNLDVENNWVKRQGGMKTDSCCGIRSLREINQSSKEDSIRFPDETNIVPDALLIEGTKSSLAGSKAASTGEFSKS